MKDRRLTFFASDVHLGLDVSCPRDREARFVQFLRSIPKDETEALYLLGDIWDFWYEYRDVVPKGYVRVFAALADLMDSGVSVYFFQGNHDVWTYSYFEELGMKRLVQPALREATVSCGLSSTAVPFRSFSACFILGSPSGWVTAGRGTTGLQGMRSMCSRGRMSLCTGLPWSFPGRTRSTISYSATIMPMSV